MERMTNREVYGLKQSILRREYGATAERWETEARDSQGYFYDDRGVFCNIYRMMQEAMEAMKSVENNSICVAFNRYYDGEHETLERIYQVFVEKERKGERNA